MTLVGRTLAFVLGILGVVLLALTGALYGLARSELYHDVDVRLASALRALVTVAETHPRGLEWEPQQHRITDGVDFGPEEVRWIVSDGEGALLTRSENLRAPESAQIVAALRESAAADTAPGGPAFASVGPHQRS
jgi:hypothetical protein